ncbi:MAG: mevalonate kinase family protein [Rhodanobacteraceae bacterium]
MRVTASAPGKLVLLGEYAVLDGSPALVQAVNRRARAALTPVTGECWEIVSPTLELEARVRVGVGGAEWLGTPAPELAWLASLFSQLPFASKLTPCRVELESNAFYLDQGGGRLKLGLGSSAALTVALLGALHAYAGQPAPTLAACIAVHRAIQHGRGSGIDIAAALAGGLSRFELRESRAQCVPMQLPHGLHWCCVFSGRPASTAAMLAKIAEWRERAPAEYTRRMSELATIASRGVDAVASHDAASLLSSLHDYAQALARFGEAGGVDIVSRGHRLLAALAADCGVVYKSCGAGGGDVGVTFAMDDMRLREFAGRATEAGFAVIELGADPRGLETNVAD